MRNIIILVIIIIVLICSVFYLKIPTITNKFDNDTNNSSKLIVFGDIGHFDTPLQKMVNNIMPISKNDKVILLGDNFYPDGVKTTFDPLWRDYSNIFKNIPKQIVHAVMGNHDYHKNPNAQINTYYWNTPNFFYKTSLNKNVDLFVIDTVQLYPEFCGITYNKIQQVHDKTITELIYRQLSWLKTELNNSNKKYKIVLGHYPIISNGLYLNNIAPLYDILYPIFKQYNVNAYVSGHEHNIQYIKQKYNDYTLNQFIIGSSSHYRKHEYSNLNSKDMYNDKDNFTLQIRGINNLYFDFINSKNKVQYSYRI